MGAGESILLTVGKESFERIEIDNRDFSFLERQLSALLYFASFQSQVYRDKNLSTIQEFSITIQGWISW